MYNRQSYYATGANTQKVVDLDDGWYLEHNTAIDMYRLNHARKIPIHMMGYTPHRAALVLSLNSFLKRKKR